jgi:FAD/FMN-containing dehydrogenase
VTQPTHSDDARSLLEQLRQLVGDANVISDTAGQAALQDARKRYQGCALALVRPPSTEALAAVVRACRAQRVPLLVQGGNTGLMGGATPDASGRTVVLQLSHLNRIREIDPDNDTITVEAGCILQDVEDAARAADRLFALSLGAQGSCTIGGNLGTNAGGTQVLRYGNVRELTLGLEVVTAEGEIWHGLRGLRKDNTGYDLRDLYIGSEGTLGIITAATLKLHPLPKSYCTGLLAFAGLAEAVAFLSEARKGFGPALTGFELISTAVFELIQHNLPQTCLPVEPGTAGATWYALVETSETQDQEHARSVFEQVLGTGLEKGLLIDAIVAQSEAQRERLWLLREHQISAAQNAEGPNIKHDISLPISRIAAFVSESVARLKARYPDCRPLIFGHLGDGNLHFNVSGPVGQDARIFLQEEHAVHAIVHDTTHAFGGSISAEHGIGQAKRDVLPHYKSEIELQLMRRIKQALDPLNLLNPGKVLQVTP